MKDKRLWSVVTELTESVPHKSRHHFVETRALQIIAGFENVVRLIESTYDNETAEDLKKRLFNAARTGDSKKFSRGIKHVIEGEKK